jgi:hypothetical protein
MEGDHLLPFLVQEGLLFAVNFGLGDRFWGGDQISRDSPQLNIVSWIVLHVLGYTLAVLLQSKNTVLTRNEEHLWDALSKEKQ